ncbi:MAG: co-chaperone GroES [Bacteroidales bacterium]|nr:co-chaperone GroES [Bacteroidales bacterium]
MKELQPLNQNVILDITDDKKEQTSAGGIIIPDTAREKPMFAKVVSLSNIDNCEIAIGDMVVYKKFSGTEIEFEGKKYLTVPYADLLAKVVEVDAI